MSGDTENMTGLENILTESIDLTAFTKKKGYGIHEREAQWATQQRTQHGLQSPETIISDRMISYGELSELAEQAWRRAEIARLREELYTFKGHGHESSEVKMKGLETDTIQRSYTV